MASHEWLINPHLNLVIIQSFTNPMCPPHGVAFKIVRPQLAQLGPTTSSSTIEDTRENPINFPCTFFNGEIEHGPLIPFSFKDMNWAL